MRSRWEGGGRGRRRNMKEIREGREKNERIMEERREERMKEGRERNEERRIRIVEKSIIKHTRRKTKNIKKSKNHSISNSIQSAILPNSSSVLISFLLICGVRSAVGFEMQRFANEPSAQTAVIGSTVVLPCRVINRAGTLQWTKDDFGLGNERELNDYERYKMIGSDEEGDFSLQISPVTLQDDAQFQCQVTGYQDIPGVRSRTAKLTVTVPPARPYIEEGTVLKTRTGDAVQLTCAAEGGKPAAELQWLDGMDREVTEGIEYSSELMEDGQRYNAKSTLSFIADTKHHKKMFTCSASNPALNQPLTTKIRLEVSYPPEITISQDKDGYKEGDTAILSCTGQANPSDITYRWYRKGELIGNNSTQLVVKNVRRESNFEDITCEATNIIGPSTKITRISVHYAPTFKQPLQDQYAEIGENITLHCDVDSNPDPTIVWVNQETQTVVGTGSEVIVTVDRGSIGNYQCIAKVKGFHEITDTVGVLLKGPPQVRSESVQWGNIGETVLVECIVKSATPDTVSVIWTHHGYPVDINNRRFEVTDDVTSNGLRHTLVIHNARPSDFGAYNCSVQNEYGSDISKVVLTKKKTLPLLVILCGVTGGIVFVLVAAIVAILCAKRSAAKHKDSKVQGLPEKTVALQMNDQNSTANESDIKGELDGRTGSSMSNRDVNDGEGGWGEKERGDLDPSSPYISQNHPYLYPEAYTAMPINSHGGLQYNAYNQPILPSHHPPNPPLGGYTIAGGLRSYRDLPTQQPPYGYKGGTGTPHQNLIYPQNQNQNQTPNHMLGIPFESNKYIMPTRTQVMQGSLATHV